MKPSHLDSVAPNRGYSKYMNMGQLMEGMEAVQCFEKGVQIMQSVLDTESDPQGKASLKREISNGLVNIAELWMTDLCFDASAESRCEASVARAIQCDGK